MKVSEAIERARDTTFFKPWKQRLPEHERTSAWIRLAKQVGPRHACCTFESYVVPSDGHESRKRQASVLADVVAWVERFGKDEDRTDRGGLVLYGAPGTGKDHLVIAAMAELIFTHGITCAWVDGLTLFDKFRQAIGDGGHRRLFNALQEPMVLCVSDPVPPKGNATEFATEILQRVVDLRYRFCKSTWLTINASGPEAEERLASQLISRVRHNSLCLKCDWPDYRQRLNLGDA